MNSGKILVPLSLSPGSRTALIYAARMAERLNVSLVLLHVVQLNIADEQLGIPRAKLIGGLLLEAHERLRELAGALGVKVPMEFVVEQGRPVDVILAKAASVGVEAIVMVTHGCPRWLRWLHRNTALKVLRLTTCPVWMMSPGPNENSALTCFLDPGVSFGQTLPSESAKNGRVFGCVAWPIYGPLIYKIAPKSPVENLPCDENRITTPPRLSTPFLPAGCVAAFGTDIRKSRGSRFAQGIHCGA